MPMKPHPWKPDRRPVRAIALYNGSEDHEWGLHPNWWQYGVPWLYQTMKDSYAKGFRRFMWSLPAGRENAPNVPWPSAQWQLLNTCGIATMSPASTVQQDLAQCITPFLKSDPDIQLVIYFGGVIKSAADRDVVGAWVPDPTSARDRRIMHANFDGFVALTPNRARPQIGFWFDNSSPSDKRDQEYTVVEWLRAQSLWAGMEAVANDGGSRRNMPNMSFVNKVAMFGVRQFFSPTLVADTLANRTLETQRATWCFDPDTSEIGFFLAGYPASLTASAGRTLLTKYHKRGFILGTYAERWEKTIMDIVGH